ncbi:MAG: CehA/McbA family metallohydrolase, partial [Vicinamibacterales bacterium]
MKKLLFMMAALVAAIAVYGGVTLPPRPLTLAAPGDGTIAGILHVHTNRSDGLSGPDEIAAAAAQAGLKFIAFTDHGDATRRPDPPQYRAGVLCLDGVEISTNGGHYVALDMPASPYPLGGEARDVVEDVRRLGGFGIAAHPDSPKPQLRWTEWRAPFDGIEMINPDTGWRLWAQQANSATPWHARRRLISALIDYPFRPTAVITSLVQPSGAVEAWEALTRRRRVVAIAGVDAHAKLAPRSADPGDSRYALPLPGYESSFRVLSIHVKTDRPFSGDAVADGRVLMRAIRSGHLYTAIDGAATPASFEFTATNEHGTVNEGDELGVGGAVTLRVRSNAPPQFSTIIRANGAVIGGEHHAEDFTVEAGPEPAVYWVEIRATGIPYLGRLSWVRSNPIYVRSTEPVAQPSLPPATVIVPIFSGTTDGWRTEHDPTSLAAVDLAPIMGGAELRFRYGLAGGAPIGQVAALAFDTPNGVAAYDRLRFSIRAEHPMRI